MNLFLGKSSEKHLKCEKYDKRKARAFAWDFVYSLRQDRCILPHSFTVFVLFPKNFQSSLFLLLPQIFHTSDAAIL